MAFIVYGGSLSPFVRKVRVVLIEKSLPYELDQINPFSPPANFGSISPLKRIPVFRDTDLPEPNTLPDSSIISDYIEHKHPEPRLYPRDPYQRARALWYEEYADTVVGPAIGPGIFFERIVRKMLRGQPDEAVVAATLKEKLPRIFDYLEAEIGTKEFLVGNTFSIADISVATHFVNFGHAGEGIESKRWPNLSRYTHAILARPSFTAMIEEERPIAERFRAA